MEDTTDNGHVHVRFKLHIHTMSVFVYSILLSCSIVHCSQLARTPLPVETLQPNGTPQPVKTPQPDRAPQPVETSQPDRAPQPVKTLHPDGTPQLVETLHLDRAPQPDETSQLAGTPQPVETPQLTGTQQLASQQPVKNGPSTQGVSHSSILRIVCNRIPLPSNGKHNGGVYSYRTMQLLSN